MKAAPVLLLLMLSACAVADSSVSVSETAPGFFWGLLHGFISPFAFIGSLFSDDIAVYSVPNSGGWYDAGFIIGFLSMAGGGGKASRRKG